MLFTLWTQAGENKEGGRDLNMIQLALQALHASRRQNGHLHQRFPGLQDWGGNGEGIGRESLVWRLSATSAQSNDGQPGVM